MSQIQSEQNRPVAVPAADHRLQAFQRGRDAPTLAQKASFNTTWQNLKKHNPKLKSTGTQEKFSHATNHTWLEMREKHFHLKPIVAEDSTERKHDPKMLVWHQGLWKTWQSN